MAGVSEDIIFNIVTSVGAFAEGMDRAIHGLDDLDKGMGRVEKSVSFVNQTLAVFVGNLGIKVVEAATKAFGVLKAGFDQFVSIAKDATMQAARIEVQWRTLSLTAGNAGESIEAMTEHVQALRAAGIKTGEALEIVTQFLANELPVENIKELARRAQDMAVVIGRDSTEAFQRFNWFLQTGNSEWIRTMGITKTANQMLSEYAETQGKVIKALSDRERKEALIQGLMKETLRYEGAYEEALKDPYKRWTSLPRLISNVTEVLGAVFVPLMGTVVDIASDALEKLERLFRVTKKEAKETGATIGEWKEGFLKLRAVVQAFADWFMSIWERVTGGFNEAAEGMMDRFVDAIINGVNIAADALRRFATFIASIFGGTAPAGITAETIARVTPTPAPEAAAREAPPVAAPVEVMAAPEEAAKLLEKPVAPPSAADIARYGELTASWTAMTEELARATNAAAEARERLAEAEEWLEEASERVYDLQNEMAEFMLETAEIPERFTRGRKRQLEMELLAAEEEEHERQKAVEDQRELLDLAEEYERTIQDATDAIYDEMEALADSIADQAEAYDEWLAKLQEAQAISLEEPVQAVVNQFESLDDLTATYLEEVRGELAPAFASIETSVLSIVSSLGAAWEKAKGLKDTLLTAFGEWAEKLEPTKAIFQWLWDLIQKIVAKVQEAITVYEQITAIADIAMPGGAAGAPLLAGEEESLYEKFSDWLKGLSGQKDKAEEVADEVLAEPFIKAAERASGEIVGTSILPDLVRDILDWFGSLADDVGDPLSRFADKAISTFGDLTESWLLDIDDLVRGLDKLTGRFDILEAALKGLEPMPESLKLAANGSFKVVTVNLQGSTFGEGLSEWEVKDWIFEAIGDLV